jgi:hypothetical protein
VRRAVEMLDPPRVLEAIIGTLESSGPSHRRDLLDGTDGGPWSHPVALEAPSRRAADASSRTIDIDVIRPDRQCFPGLSFERAAWIHNGSHRQMTQQGSIYGPKATARPLMDADLESLPATMRQGRAIGSEASRLVKREHFAEKAGYASIEKIVGNRVDKDADAGSIPDLDHKAAAREAEGSAGGPPSRSEIQAVFGVPVACPHGCLGINTGKLEPAGNPAGRLRGIPGDTLATIINSVPTAAVHG